MSSRLIHVMLLLVVTQISAPDAVDIGAEAEIQEGFAQNWLRTMENTGSSSGLVLSFTLNQSCCNTAGAPAHVCEMTASQMPMANIYGTLPHDVFPNDDAFQRLATITTSHHVLDVHSYGMVGITEKITGNRTILPGLLLPVKSGIAVAVLAIPNAYTEGLRGWIDKLTATTSSTLELDEAIRYGLDAQITQITHADVFKLFDASSTESSVLSQFKPTSGHNRSLDETGTLEFIYPDKRTAIVSIGRNGSVKAIGPERRVHPGLIRCVSILMREAEEAVYTDLFKPALEEPLRIKVSEAEALLTQLGRADLATSLDIPTYSEELFSRLIANYKPGQIISQSDLTDELLRRYAVYATATSHLS